MSNITYSHTSLREIFSCANQKSNDNIYKFALDIFGIKKSKIEGSLNVPILGLNCIQKFIPQNIDNDTKNRILLQLADYLEKDLHSAEAMVVYVPNLIEELFPDEDFDDSIFDDDLEKPDSQFKNSLDKKEIENHLNSIFPNGYFILYSEDKVIESVEEAIAETNLSPEQIKNRLIKKYTQIFTHEKCHLLAERSIEPGYFFNGCQLSSTEIEQIIPTSLNNFYKNSAEQNLLWASWNNRNEIFIDLLSQTISHFSANNSFEESVKQTVNDLKKYEYDSQGFNREFLPIAFLFTCYSEELAYWGLVGAKENPTNNLLMTFFKHHFTETTKNKPDFIDDIRFYFDTQSKGMSSTKRETLALIANVPLKKEKKIEDFSTSKQDDPLSKLLMGFLKEKEEKNLEK